MTSTECLYKTYILDYKPRLLLSLNLQLVTHARLSMKVSGISSGHKCSILSWLQLQQPAVLLHNVTSYYTSELHIAASARKDVSVDYFGANQLVDLVLAHRSIELSSTLHYYACMHANSSGVDPSINFRGNSLYTVHIVGTNV